MFLGRAAVAPGQEKRDGQKRHQRQQSTTMFHGTTLPRTAPPFIRTAQCGDHAGI
jgi:hypothetical protein